MARQCPKCAANSIKVSEMLFSDFRCPSCGAVVGVHRVANWVANVIITGITLTTVLMVLVQVGMYAALLWLPFPIGALSYLKARFSPLQVRGTERRV